MKGILQLFVSVFILWLPFSIAAICAIPISLFAVIIGQVFTDKELFAYAKKVLWDMDVLFAGMIGFSGEHSLSAECGAYTDCKLCVYLCKFLNWIQPGHCEGAARYEGLIK